ncbi:MFS transporter [Actinoplanes sp. RD1]|uniref:MFS transporter n=1 Tax=Actinoplanes sp. RD1 TaxID=3064538 RepID=UPI002740B484|nr:MFS transporter [Actinoplanes sp. RD1]
MAALLLPMFFAMASNTMVLTGLPQIMADLHGTQTQYSWIVTTSLLVLTVATPVWGRLADRADRRALLRNACLIYAAGSTAAGLAPDPWVIVACRVLIGIGAGGIVTLTQLVGTSLTDEVERPRFFGSLGAVMAVATVVAPALGGLVVNLGGWRWTFWATVPLAVLAVALIQAGIPPAPAAAGTGAPFDLAGTVLVVVTALLAMVWITVIGPQPGWASAPSLTVLVVLAALTALAVILARRAPAPLVPPHLLANAQLVKVLVASAAVGVVTFATSVYLSLYLQSARDYSAGTSGLLLVPMAVTTLAGSLAAGRVISATRRDKQVLLAGSAATLLGLIPLCLLGTATSAAVVAAAGALIGLGLGCTSQQLVVTAQRHLAAADIGVGSSLVLFVRSLATVLCLSAFGVVVAAALPGHDALTGYTTGIRYVFQVTGVIAVAGTIALLSLRAPVRPTTPEEIACPTPR